MDELLNVIKAEVEAREATEGTKLRLQQLLNHKNTSNHPLPTHPTIGVFLTNSEKFLCVYCNGNHYSSSSEKVQSLQD